MQAGRQTLTSCVRKRDPTDCFDRERATAPPPPAPPTIEPGMRAERVAKSGALPNWLTRSETMPPPLGSTDNGDMPRPSMGPSPAADNTSPRKCTEPRAELAPRGEPGACITPPAWLSVASRPLPGRKRLTLLVLPACASSSGHSWQVRVCDHIPSPGSTSISNSEDCLHRESNSIQSYITSSTRTSSNQVATYQRATASSLFCACNAAQDTVVL
jgi:hypothetical protein